MLRLCLLLSLILAAPAMAQVMPAEQPLAVPAQEMRAKALFRELRCKVCDGQSLADSNATLAAPMRSLVREKVAAGQSDVEILAYFSSRYGQDILMRPPLRFHTWLLWLGPVLMLAVGAVLFARYFRKRAHG